MSAPAFAAVDWGTTRMRVWLMDAAGAVLEERRSDEGLITAREGNRFGEILERQLDAMGAEKNLAVWACGMVGSRQGWVEAPYVEAPAALDAVLRGAVLVPGTARPVHIVPGMSQGSTSQGERPDVMRGEETQLAGLRNKLGKGAGLVCMPGTHCKWVEVQNGAVTRFTTYLTGELFSLLSERSILSHSIGQPAPRPQAGAPAFTDACRTALEGGDWSGNLFAIRAGSLLQNLSPGDAGAKLSGLLIGGEMASARKRFGASQTVVLVASGAMAELYTAALEAAGFTVEPADADEAVRAGLFEAARGGSGV